MLTKSMRADLGVMISASHNLFEDNGIKLFGPQGFKLSDEVEKQIEQFARLNPRQAFGAERSLGRARRIDVCMNRYIESPSARCRAISARRLARGGRLRQRRAYKVVPEALWELGADVISIGVDRMDSTSTRNADRPRRRR